MFGLDVTRRFPFRRAKLNCTDHILCWRLETGLFVSLHVCVDDTMRKLSWWGSESFTSRTRPSVTQSCCRKFGTYEPGEACNVTWVCLCVFRVPSGAWWWVWWWVCVGWCWSLPSRLLDVALWTRPPQCCAVSTTSISPYCSAASRPSWLP